MNKTSGQNLYPGTEFERIFIAVIAIAAAAVLIYLTVMGPMYLGRITFKTHPDVYNQLIAQDSVNMYFLAPVLLIGAWGLLNRKRYAKYFLIATPLFLMYYAMSYAMGWEWVSADFVGNSHLYFFYYLFILIASLLILLYSMHIFPAKQRSFFGKRGLAIYSTLMCVFMGLFAMMWMQEVFEVFQTGTSRGYDMAPTAFWLVRTFDLGFSIPLAFISVYLLWTRPQTTFAIQMLLYGFFVTMS
ncbi:MAG: hypothetical protein U1B83_06850, partial [Candidatus Cloacimonadaceae bacterium]|nr:hypothetical protein [Candidatus Cloacimonadaceae bacterium]